MPASIYQIMKDVRKLSREDQLRLVNNIVESVLQSPPQEPHRTMRYSEFRGYNLSSEDEVTIGKWQLEDRPYHVK